VNLLSERYGRVPYRLYDALEASEITFSQFGILAFLEGRASHKKDGSIPKASYTLRGLTDAMDWPWKGEKLRRDLHELREAGWIGFEVRQGQRTDRSKYVFQLLRCRVGGDLRGSPEEVGRKFTSSGGSAEEREVRTVVTFNGDGNLLSGGSRQEDTSDFRLNTQTQNPDSDRETDAGEDVFRRETDEPQDDVVDLSPFDSVTRLLSILRDKDEKTENVFRGLERNGCMPADFENAREEILGVPYTIDRDAAYAVRAVQRHRDRRRNGAPNSQGLTPNDILAVGRESA